MGIHTRHTSLDVELAHEARLHDKLPDDVHFDFDRFLGTVSDKNFAHIAGGVDGGAETGTRTVAGSNALQASNEYKTYQCYSIHDIFDLFCFSFYFQILNQMTSIQNTYAHTGNQDVIATILRGIVRTAMRLHTPIAWELRRHATCARQMR